MNAFSGSGLSAGMLLKLEERHPEIRVCRGNADRASAEGCSQVQPGMARNGAASRGLFTS